MKTPKARKNSWVQVGRNLLKEIHSGFYYARFHRHGKPKWISLKTKLRSVADGRLADERVKWMAEDSAPPPIEGKWTFGDACRHFLADIKIGKAFTSKSGVKVKGRMAAGTQLYRQHTLEGLLKSWQAINGTDLKAIELRRLSRELVERWADYYKTQSSASRFNGTLGTLRKVISYGIKNGQIHRDPSSEVERVSITPTRQNARLPTREQFDAIVKSMRSGSHRTTQDTADFVELLAYSGARSSEAENITWSDVDFERRILTLRETKNGREREVPFNKRLEDLLLRIKKRRNDEGPEARVVTVSDVRASLNRACVQAGASRITRHGLRGYFATVALQSGVDPKTLADWMGHLDGGLLLLTKYVKANHHKAMALRVDFDSLNQNNATNEKAPG